MRLRTLHSPVPTAIHLQYPTASRWGCRLWQCNPSGRQMAAGLESRHLTSCTRCH